MASSPGTRLLLCLFSFSAAVVVLLLLQAPPRGLVASALERFLDDGVRGLLALATRRNMILLCHAILLVILRDAGVLGATPASRRSRSPPAVAAAAAAIETQTAAPARPHAAVVWRRRRPRSRAPAPAHDSAAYADARRLVGCQPAAAWAWAAAPLVTTGAQQAGREEATNQQIVLAESPRNDGDLLDHHHVEQLEHATAIAVDNGAERDRDDRRIVAVADDDEEKRVDDAAAREDEQTTAGMELMGMELADDRRFEEFIRRQRRKMRQESLQLMVRSAYHHQAVATC